MGEVDVRRSQTGKKASQGAGVGEVKCNVGKPSGPGILEHPPADLDLHSGDLQGLNIGFSVLLEAVRSTVLEYLTLSTVSL